MPMTEAQHPATPQPKPAAPAAVKPLILKKSPFQFLFPLIGVILLLLIGYALYSKFFKSTPSSSAPVEITYWGLWEPEGAMKQIFTDFENTHPNIKIKYTQSKSTDYRERLQTALQSGTGPDLFRYHHTWLPMLKDDLAVLPETVYSDTEFTAAFYPVAVSALKMPKGYMGIPLMIDGLGLYYNKSLLSAAGQAVPTSWDELRRVAKTLTVTRDGSIERAGVALGTTGNVEHWSDILGIMLLQNAANPQTPNNKLGQDALEFYTLFNRVDKVWDDSLPTSTFAFATEKVAMMLAPSWRAHDVLAINPNLDFAIAPIPQLPDTNITWASFWVEGVSQKSSSAKQQAAWELLKYLSSKDVLRQWYAGISGGVRRFGEPFSRQDMADQLTGDPYVGAYVSQGPKAKWWYLASWTHDNGLNDQTIKYYLDAVNAVNNGETPEKALSVTEQGLVQISQKYNLR